MAHLISGTNCINNSSANYLTPTHVPSKVDNAEVRKIEVLIIEDNQFLLKFFKKVIETKNTDCNFTYAKDGEEAINAVKERKFDVIFSDQKLPGGMSGAEACLYIRAHDPNVAIIVQSSQKREALAKLFENCQVTEILNGKLSLANFRNALSTALKKNEKANA
jgi:CheY-like chemotaxis protein